MILTSPVCPQQHLCLARIGACMAAQPQTGAAALGPFGGPRGPGRHPLSELRRLLERLAHPLHALLVHAAIRVDRGGTERQVEATAHGRSPLAHAAVFERRRTGIEEGRSMG